MRRGARRVGMFEDVARTIDARAFAVPHAEHAVVARARKEVGLLRTPYRGGCQVLVDTRLKRDVVSLKVRLGFPHVLIDATQGLSLIHI